MSIPFCIQCGCVADGDFKHCEECRAEGFHEDAESELENMTPTQRANANLALLIEDLSSGDVTIEDLQPEIGQLVELIETAKKEKEMDCPFYCNGVCRSCRQPVMWVRMVTIDDDGNKVVGKSMPIDPEYHEGGNITVKRNAKNELFGMVTGPDPEEKKFISHFATCPDADKWRKQDAEPKPKAKKKY